MLQKTLLPLLAIFMTASLYMIFQYAPKEKIMGDVQRIFYFHMGYVLVFTFAFTMNLIHSIRFLRTNNKLNLKLAYIHAEIGVVFTLLTLVSGMIWAKPVWGTW
ncbi:cytochrome c biogenesis protein CcsA, partial [bacterium]|nr:cytochrome c biogenesis protein CcsA [bacterium]